MTTSTTAGVPTRRAPLRAVLAGAVGNIIEWYDFSVYGYLAVVISAVFFPTGSTQLLLTFATFGVGFFMRPIFPPNSRHHRPCHSTIHSTLYAAQVDGTGVPPPRAPSGSLSGNVARSTR